MQDLGPMPKGNDVNGLTFLWDSSSVVDLDHRSGMNSLDFGKSLLDITRLHVNNRVCNF